ncbi:MAG: polysulfide reductase NrfD [Eggerthellaceae bacterium]|nr:polysulfide reductase NrfD [Eggerthellaceae bacterium]
MAESTQAVSTANQRATAPAPHRFGGKGLTIGIIVSAVVAVVGIVLWVTQLSGGLIQTNMRNLDSWGLYITSFMFFVGLSAGGLIISSVPKTFGLKGFGGISKVAVWTSICCTVCAVAFVIIDLGQPLRLWELITSSNMTSPLMWDILVITIYLVLSIVYLWAMTSNEKGRLSDRALRVISGFAFVCAILVHSVTAWIFGLQQGREFWYTALLAPWFVSSALVCGTGLVLIVVIALRKANYLSLEQSYVNTLTKLLGAFVCVDLYFFGCDLLTEAFPGGSGLEMVQTLTVGALAPFFWIEVIGCAICAVICFVPKLRTNPLIIIASALAIAGIFCKRVQLLVGGFQTANLEYPTVINGNTITFWDQGWTGAYDGLVYWPTGIEFGIALGVVGLGSLILLL